MCHLIIVVGDGEIRFFGLLFVRAKIVDAAFPGFGTAQWPFFRPACGHYFQHQHQQNGKQCYSEHQLGQANELDMSDEHQQKTYPEQQHGGREIVERDDAANHHHQPNHPFEKRRIVFAVLFTQQESNRTDKRYFGNFGRLNGESENGNPPFGTIDGGANHRREDEQNDGNDEYENERRKISVGML
jgi:hypothetical protein